MKKMDLTLKKIVDLAKKKEGVRRFEWIVFGWSVLFLAVVLVVVYVLGFVKFDWIGRFLLLISFCGIVYVLYELLGKRIVRYVDPMKVGVLVDKFTGRTNEIVREGIVLTLPTDEIILQPITMRKHEVKDDYLTMDGSITLTVDIFYAVYPDELRDFLIVEDELKNVLTARVQELIQAECGDRSTDEVISEQRALSKQLLTEMTGSELEVWMGRLGINRRKIADLESSIKIQEDLIKGRLEKALEGKEDKSKKELIKQDRIEAEKEQDRLIDFRNRRLNTTVELIEGLLSNFESILQTEISKKKVREVEKNLQNLELSFTDIPFEKANKGKEWMQNIKGLLDKLKTECGEKFASATSATEESETRERAGIEKDFHISIKATRLYDPTLDEMAKKARDAKVTMKYKQQAVITEYQTTKQTLRLLREQLPGVSDKELLDYVLAMRDKMARKKEEKVFDFPGLQEILPSVVEKFLRK